MPKRLHFIGTTGWYFLHVQGAEGHLHPVHCVNSKTLVALRKFPPSLLLPFCLWEMADDGSLALISIACLEHWVHSVGGSVLLAASGVKSIVSAIVAREIRPNFTEALGRKHMRVGRDAFGKGLPTLTEMGEKAKRLVVHIPEIRRDKFCWAFRCTESQAPCSLFCTKCLAAGATGFPLDTLDAAGLETPVKRIPIYNWTFKHVHAPAAPEIAAAALYFGAPSEPVEELKMLGRQLHAVGLDELAMVALGMRPVGRGEIAQWGRYFYWLQGHAEVHALNAVRLVGEIRKETLNYKRMLARELAVYGIITDEFDPNPVSAVANTARGAWKYKELARLHGFAEGGVVKLEARAGYALYTALFAALVLGGHVAHTFTWALVAPGYEPPKTRFAHTFDGLALTRADRRAFETLGDGDVVLVARAGLLSWSGLYALITRCRATCYFSGSPHFADAAVYDHRLSRHVGGAFALVHAAAKATGRLLPARGAPSGSWPDLIHAMGPRGGVCTKCKKSHAFEAMAMFYYPNATTDPCTENAVTYGTTVANMAIAAASRCTTLLDAAKVVARTL